MLNRLGNTSVYCGCTEWVYSDAVIMMVALLGAELQQGYNLTYTSRPFIHTVQISTALIEIRLSIFLFILNVSELFADC